MLDNEHVDLIDKLSVEITELKLCYEQYEEHIGSIREMWEESNKLITQKCRELEIQSITLFGELQTLLDDKKTLEDKIESVKDTSDSKTKQEQAIQKAFYALFDAHDFVTGKYQCSIEELTKDIHDALIAMEFDCEVIEKRHGNYL